MTTLARAAAASRRSEPLVEEARQGGHGTSTEELRCHPFISLRSMGGRMLGTARPLSAAKCRASAHGPLRAGRRATSSATTHSRSSRRPARAAAKRAQRSASQDRAATPSFRFAQWAGRMLGTARPLSEAKCRAPAHGPLRAGRRATSSATRPSRSLRRPARAVAKRAPKNSAATPSFRSARWAGRMLGTARPLSEAKCRAPSSDRFATVAERPPQRPHPAAR